MTLLLPIQAVLGNLDRVVWWPIGEFNRSKASKLCRQLAHVTENYAEHGDGNSQLVSLLRDYCGALALQIDAAKTYERYGMFRSRHTYYERQQKLYALDQEIQACVEGRMEVTPAVA